MNVLGRVWRAVSALPTERRRVWTSANRVHAEIRGLTHPDPAVRARVAAAVLAVVGAVDGVDAVTVTPATGRMIACVTDTEAMLAVLEDAMRQAEMTAGSERFGFGDRAEHPGDSGLVRREVVTLAADAAGFALAVAGRAARLARVPVEVASAVPLVQAHARLRRPVEMLLGEQNAHLALALANVVAQVGAQGPFGLVVDAAHRVPRVAERLDRQRLWCAVEPELAKTGATSVAANVGPHRRLVALPRGPIERHVDRAGAASIGAGVLGALTDSRRAAAAVLAGMPKAAILGREAFVAHLGRSFAARGILCLEGRALHRLDRVDTLVIDARVTHNRSLETGRVERVGHAPLDEITERVRALFRSAEPYRARSDGTWTLEPARKGSSTNGTGAEGEEHGEATGLQKLELRREAVVEAIVELRPVLAPAAIPLATTACQSGRHLVVAGGDDALSHRLGAHRRVPGDGQLRAVVEQLQSEGHVVALVTTEAEEALRAADIGIGLWRAGSVPWAADLLCRDLDGARLVMTASAVAHEVSRQSVALAVAGSSLAATVALSLPPIGAAARANTAVNLATLLAQANSLRAAVELNRDFVATPPVPPLWHELTSAEVLTAVRSSVAGLSRVEAASRRQVLPGDRALSLPAAIAAELVNPLTPVLAGAAALSAAIGSITDASLVAAVALLNGVLGGVQRFRVDHDVQALAARSMQPFVVRRRELLTVDPPDLVVGDVVILRAGDALPGDCRILTADGLEVDESTLTGESLPVGKSPDPAPATQLADRTSMLFEGTSITAGTAAAVIVALGDGTESSRALLVAEESRPGGPGGVEARLQSLMKITIPAAIASGVAVTVLGVTRGAPVAASLESGVSLAVAAVPEGLPILTTLAQLAAARRLAAHGALVKNPRAIEALGRVDTICADKTGTLTQGRMVLHHVADGRVEHPLEAASAGGRRVLAAALRASPAVTGERLLPHLTDRAVIGAADAAGVDAATGLTGWSRLAELPFEPTRGYHAALGACGADGASRLISVKGAPEVLLARCTHQRRDGTATRGLTVAGRRRATAAVERLARRGYRVLAVAERAALDVNDLDDDVVSGLTLVGYLALADPVRPTAAGAIKALAAAGVRVVMLTGDHPSTAAGIAAELGLLDGGGVLTGAEIDDLTDDELVEVIDTVTVFARVAPAQKVRLVGAYQRAGHTVAMTGDGTNDAPAILLSDVGVALGEHSTPAARRAADLIIPDGRIETLVQAVLEGRATWASVRESLGILLGGNLGEIAFTVAATAITGRPPLSARQLLLVNLFTDVLPSMAIAVRPPSATDPAALLREGPSASLGRPLQRTIVQRATFTAAGAGAGWVVGLGSGTRGRANTMGLAALVGTQLGQTLLVGGHDPMVVAASVGSAAALVTVIQTPLLSRLFGCTPLDPLAWATVLTTSTGASLASALVPKRFLAGGGQADPVAPATAATPSPDAPVAPRPVPSAPTTPRPPRDRRQPPLMIPDAVPIP